MELFPFYVERTIPDCLYECVANLHATLILYVMAIAFSLAFSGLIVTKFSKLNEM